MFPLILMLASAAGWVLAVVLFEGLFDRYRTKVAGRGDKPLFCRIWWVLLFLFALCGGILVFVLHLPFLLPIALSHIDLSCRKYEIITVQEVLLNIPAAVRAAAARLKPFFSPPPKTPPGTGGTP